MMDKGMIGRFRLPGLRPRFGTAAVVVAVCLTAWWARVEQTSPDRHGMRAAWLSRLEVAYPLGSASLLLVEGVALGLLIAWRRQRGRMRTALARMALARFASLLALVAAEALCRVYLAWAHRVPELGMVRGGPPRSGPGDDVTIGGGGESSAPQPCSTAVARFRLSPSLKPYCARISVARSKTGSGRGNLSRSGALKNNEPTKS